MGAVNYDLYKYGFKYSLGDRESMKRAMARQNRSPSGIRYMERQWETVVQFDNWFKIGVARRWVNEWRGRIYGQYDFDGLAQAIYEGEHDL